MLIASIRRRRDRSTGMHLLDQTHLPGRLLHPYRITPNFCPVASTLHGRSSSSSRQDAGLHPDADELRSASGRHHAAPASTRSRCHSAANSSCKWIKQHASDASSSHGSWSACLNAVNPGDRRYCRTSRLIVDGRTPEILVAIVKKRHSTFLECLALASFVTDPLAGSPRLHRKCSLHASTCGSTENRWQRFANNHPN